MGINEISDLKPKDVNLTMEQFPDGTQEVPLTGPQGEVLGTAVVTFKDGQWAANLTMSAGAAKSLGLNLAMVHTTFKNGETLHLGVEPAAPAE